MNKPDYLSEERYQKSKKKIINASIIILVIGVLIGGSLITTGLIKQSKINDKYSESSKMSRIESINSDIKAINEQLETERLNLIDVKTQLENKIKPINDQIKSLERVKFTGLDDDYYARKDKIEELKKSISSDEASIASINKVIENGYSYCPSDYVTNKKYTYVFDYCSLASQISSKQSQLQSVDREFSDSKKEFDSARNVPFYMIGAFVIITSGMFAGIIYATAKRREITAFGFQQVMPVAQEGLEKMAPTIGKVGKTIAKEMAPVYGEVAREISKGIKEGLKEDNKENNVNK